MTDDSTPGLLLVEDNPADARYIKELIGENTELSARLRGDELGTAVDVTGTGSPALYHETRLEDGLERIAEVDVDVVLLDLDLPDSAGLETLSAVLERTTLPVVVLTGLRDRETGIEALRRGADEFLVKDEINSDLLVRSIYHAIERRAHERELERYKVLMEESTDVNAVITEEGILQYVTPSIETVLGFGPDEFVGENVLSHIHPDDHEVAVESLDRVLDGESVSPFEVRFEDEDGSWVTLEARARNLTDDSLIDGIVVYTRDVTERKQREERLARQREQLAALNQLNSVVQEITHAVVESSTREDLERAVCRILAAAESYRFAWIGRIDAATDELVPRAEAGVEGYLDEVEITVDDSPTGQGPTGRAVHSGEVEVARDVGDDPGYEPWQDHAAKYGFRSTAAIPIMYEGSLYGVLNVYTERQRAFDDDERDVIGQLGEVIGHAIAGIERKQALMSEDVVELELTIRDAFDAPDAPDGGSITFERVVPLGDERYAVYGRANEGGLDMLHELVDEIPAWNDVTVIAERSDESRFEIGMSEPPVLSAVASRGGRVVGAIVEDGDYRLVVHLPPSGDVRALVEVIQDAHPGAELIAQRRTSRSEAPSADVRKVFDEQLTGRQQSALEAAYFSGFFEWPRDSSGEEVAEMLGVTAPTFHQHLRAAENEILGAVFEAEDQGERERDATPGA